jgi:hypothetical protein
MTMAVKARTSSPKGKVKKGNAAKPPARKTADKAGKAAAGAARKQPRAGKPRPAKKPAHTGRRGTTLPIAAHLKTLRSALQKTGRPLTHWVDLLDRVGGPELRHDTLVRVLTETQKIDRWSANCIALSYRGLYGFGDHAYLLEHQDGLDLLGEWK